MSPHLPTPILLASHWPMFSNNPQREPFHCCTGIFIHLYSCCLPPRMKPSSVENVQRLLGSDNLAPIHLQPPVRHPASCAPIFVSCILCQPHSDLTILPSLQCLRALAHMAAKAEAGRIRSEAINAALRSTTDDDMLGSHGSCPIVTNPTNE
jgi:hypothetical protein